jgi:fermentation-respiration switch protein FrsA (DUF1100 family)
MSYATPKTFKIILATVSLIAIVTVLIPWIAAGTLTAPVNHSVGILPQDLSGESVQFPSRSGSLIHGWFIPGQQGLGTVVLMHGVRADRTSMLDRARFLSRAGYSVLLFDFQAHGESPGKRITLGYLESMDAQASIQYLRERNPDEKIGVIGVSMGGAAALLANPALDIQSIILEMVYPTIDEAIADRIQMRLGSWSEVLTPLLSIQLRPRLGISANQLRPIDRISSLTEPKLLIVGAEDQHTTLAESRHMFEAASEPKQLWIIEGAPHTDLHKRAGTEYERKVLTFFQETLNSAKQ